MIADRPIGIMIDTQSVILRFEFRLTDTDISDSSLESLLRLKMGSS